MNRFWIRIKERALLRIDSFLPESLLPGSDKAFRARAYVMGAWSVAFVILFGAVLRQVHTEELTPLFFVAILVGCLIASGPWLMRRSGQVEWPGRLAVWLLVVLVCVVSVVGGGIDAGIIMAAPLIVLMCAFFIVGNEVLWLAVFFCVWFWGLYWYQSTHELPQWIVRSTESVWFLRTLVLTMCVVAVALLARGFEWSRAFSEREMRKSQERYALALLASNDGIFDWDVIARTTHLSSRFCTLLGYDAEVLVLEKPFDKRIIGASFQKQLSQLETSLKSGQVDFDLDLQMQMKDGALRWFQLRGSAIHHDASLARVVGSIRDISARRQLSELKDEFVSNVSHELRTPLTSVVGSLTLLRGLETVPEEQREKLLSLADRNAQRLLRLVGDLLDFQRLAHDEVELELVPVDGRAFLEEALSLHVALADQRNVSIALGVVEEGLSLSLDVARMMQAMGNLISNAIKVSSAGSTVELSVRRVGGCIELAIKDEGPGIPEGLRERLFERFVRDSSTDQSKSRGTGLGLAIAKTLVEIHGGELRFETAQGVGTTFVISIPFVDVHEMLGELG